MLLTLLLLLAHLNSGHHEPLQVPIGVPQEERQVLMNLFSATDGVQWTNRNGWRSPQPVCDWHGVWCDFVDGNAERPVVAGLSLSNNNLRGTLPSSLSELKYLQRLDVSRNRLSGEVPEAVLDRWDRHDLEFHGSGNSFSNMVVH